MDITKSLAEEFDLKLEYSQNLINLLDEGCTVPFISRYRKEMHGTCDDQTIRAFADRLNYLRNLEKRKEADFLWRQCDAAVIGRVHHQQGHNTKKEKQ